MSSHDLVFKFAQEWQPEEQPNELKYRDSLLAFLRERLKNDKAKIEKEYRHSGTTTDIYVQLSNWFSGTTEVFLEVKRDLNQKTKLNRLVGQIEDLKPKKNDVIVVLCGETDPALLSRLKEQYEIRDVWDSMVKVVVKPKPHPLDAAIRSSAKRRSLAALSLVAALSVPHARAQRSNTLPSWPKDKGEYIATSSEGIPAFPRTLSGYRSENGKDFWDKPFPSRGTVRIFQGNDWQGLPSFPNTMNGCSSGVFMIRWRSSDPNVRVQSSVRYSKNTSGTMKDGSFGYMSGTNCEQPMFKFGSTGDKSTLVDVYYELKFWQAAP